MSSDSDRARRRRSFPVSATKATTPRQSRLSRADPQFVERVGVSGGRPSQHRETEPRGTAGDTHPDWDHLQHYHAALRLQRPAHFREERDARGVIEVVQEVGDERHVVTCTEVDFEGVARLQVDAVANALRGRVLPGDLEHRRPVHGRHFHLRVSQSERDAENAV